MHRDVLHRFVFEHSPIRGEIVHLDASWRAVLDRREYPPALRTVLGEFLAASALLTATLKFEGRLTIQMQGQGPVTLLVVECTSSQTMRGLAHWNEEIGALGFDEMIGDGKLVITIDPEQGRERYQGIVERVGNSVSTALEHYFDQSEQLQTRLWLAADETRAAGMLIQRLPEREMPDHDAWRRAVHLGSTVTAQELLELPARDLLRRLYHEEDLRLFSHVPMSFRCSCSRGRVVDTLRLLGRDEIRSIVAERGRIDVACEFCGQCYVFDGIDAEEVFLSVPPPDLPPTQH